MSEDDLTIAQLRANRQQVIEEIRRPVVKELQRLMGEGRIAKGERELAQQSIHELELGIGMMKELHRQLLSVDPELSDRLEYAFSLAMRGLFYAGGLTLTSKTMRSLTTSEGRKAVQDKFGEIRDLRREAIRYALTQPPSRPFGKAAGLSAIADRALDAANKWLRENGQKADLTVPAIQKRLERTPHDFPRSDEWPN